MGPGSEDSTDFNNKLPLPPDWNNVLGNETHFTPPRQQPEVVAMPERVVPRGGGSYPG